MNFSQKLGLFILILISVSYAYFSFWGDKNIDIQFPTNKELAERPTDNNEAITTGKEVTQDNIKETTEETIIKTIKIFVSDSNGNIRPVNRKCETSIEKSCFEFAINELIAGPTKWEKSKGFTSEIPQETKILSIRESSDRVMIDLSSMFEAGGGTESTYTRIRQLIKTSKANTTLPVYLYINGKQANVIGGEGIMIKQPLNERSLDD